MNDASGVLYIVATPIGNLSDITTRALEILQQVAYIAAEDTRHSAKLLNHYNINSRVISLHEHNEIEQSKRIVSDVANGQSVAVISDAGTPLISDPGYKLVELALSEGCSVSPIPGPSALTAALSVAGQPTDRFSFEGFLPAKTSARKNVLTALAQEPRTMVFYESTHRIAESLADIGECLGLQRSLTLVKEISKSFQQIKKGTIPEVLDWLCAEVGREKGEFVLVVRGFQSERSDFNPDALRLLEMLLREMPPKLAAAIVADHYGERKNALYKWVLSRLD